MEITTIQNSPSYILARKEICEQIRLMTVVNKARPRCISIYRIRKAVGLPETAEGIQEARNLTMVILTELVERKELTSFEIGPKYDGGAEWAFLTFPKKPRMRKSENCTIPPE